MARGATPIPLTLRAPRGSDSVREGIGLRADELCRRATQADSVVVRKVTRRHGAVFFAFVYFVFGRDTRLADGISHNQTLRCGSGEA
jgi:hypothetical protein